MGNMDLKFNPYNFQETGWLYVYNRISMQLIQQSEAQMTSNIFNAK